MSTESSTVDFAGDKRKATTIRYLEQRNFVLKYEDGKLVEFLVRRPEDRDEEFVEIVYDTTPGDFTALGDALARYYERGSPEYTTRFEMIKEKQEEACGPEYIAPEYCGKMHMVFALDGAGDLILACARQLSTPS